MPKQPKQSRPSQATTYYRGRPATVINEAGVGQIALSIGNKVMEKAKPLTKSIEPVRTGQVPSVPLGNDVARNVGAGGPGAGRVIDRTGGQGQHGPVAGNPPIQGRDMLSEFGPESPTSEARLRRR
jgi:hypothetical protein